MNDSLRCARLQRARISLEGLSVGDAFGECFFLSLALAVRLARGGLLPSPSDYEDEFVIEQIIALREVPAKPPWRWTDDTAMAIAIVENLRDHGAITQSTLARAFGEHFGRQPARGYGAAMHTLLPELARGADWHRASAQLFGGGGSYGNGAAMRAAPIGAYFGDDIEAVAQEAKSASEITHAHPEGIAGGVAVAVAAALAWQDAQDTKSTLSAGEFIERVLAFVPSGAVRAGIEKARDLPGLEETSIEEAIEMLGNGSKITAPDTVPFVLWCAAQQRDDYEAALWLTVSGLGDRDTTCAMVGGIVALSSQTPIPAAWLDNREALPAL